MRPSAGSQASSSSSSSRRAATGSVPPAFRTGSARREASSATARAIWRWMLAEYSVSSTYTSFLARSGTSMNTLAVVSACPSIRFASAPAARSRMSSSLLSRSATSGFTAPAFRMRALAGTCGDRFMQSANAWQRAGSSSSTMETTILSMTPDSNIALLSSGRCLARFAKVAKTSRLLSHAESSPPSASNAPMATAAGPTPGPPRATRFARAPAAYSLATPAPSLIVLTRGPTMPAHAACLQLSSWPLRRFMRAPAAWQATSGD
mmetsp:Transcript_101487/g.327512  ORF Transcript_101487/g.327512 Transcript_101487/m.327512 type:complete len:264 (-) Transcript_101487:125-916(-)